MKFTIEVDDRTISIEVTDNADYVFVADATPMGFELPAKDDDYAEEPDQDEETDAGGSARS